MGLDLVVSGGTVIDGTGRARYRADIGVKDRQISVVARDPRDGPRAEKTVDATGRIVAPGFIDSNSHADWALPRVEQRELLAPLLLQGITTTVGGGCGYSPAPVKHDDEAALDRLTAFLHEPFPYRWSSFAEMLSVLEAGSPLLNAAFMVGQNTLRNAVMGASRRAPSTAELRTMRDLVQQALRDGAIGLAGNLNFRPGSYARNEELRTLAGVVAEQGGICSVHGRAYTWISDAYSPFGAPHNLRAVRDLVEVARRSRARLQVSHLLFAGRRTWRTCRRVLDELHEARRDGVDIGFDAVPYTVGNGPIELLFPSWFVDGFPESAKPGVAHMRLRAESALQRALLGMSASDVRLMSTSEPDLKRFEGLTFEAIARELGTSAVDAEVHVARRAGLQGAAVLVGTFSGADGREQPLAEVLRDPLCAFITNAAITGGRVTNPAAEGAFPRVLGHFSRELGLFSLEEAIRRMTSYPAERMGLKGIGRIAEGCWADLVVFDPERVGAASTTEDSRPSGIEAVLVSGEVAAAGGQVISGPGRGRILRRS